ncbi:ATP-dependent DNA ligase [Microbacterium imperiale]|uniref:DNA ligase (ATP) n=1 Tax=Microbacterium imperiale TaxID=33884 RepID=A0A9W6M3J4_9MICO|nr:ATP-dependent DNA ligase [Microbacterium imperiale]MBP2420383.1 ATP-dependent DNA ligase [Microbacterium imperiale]MDS0197758.1 ATP-dependent DNA ligase [Microbacterium imperiale]BFE40725.1 ATP-dependent DNA ligase [Microbacterium imperiale]GLJ80130.1 DNA ligase C1 [Microbacterium imperiale]
MPYDIPAPMLAKSVLAVPDPARTPGGLSFEPKWDGFRALVSWDGTDVEIGSRGSKPLTRYFPELVDAFSRLLPEPCLIDGEIVVATDAGDGQRLQWEALSQRIHPAASRVALLSEQTPAMFIAFDLLARGDRDLRDEPFAVRRAELVDLLQAVPDPLHVTRATDDVETARRWLAEFEGAGLDGVVAKPLAQPYAPGKRTMFKIKHARTADVVALGYRIHKSGSGVGSLLVGLYDDDGELHGVGGVAAWSDKRRQELVAELEPLVERDAAGAAVTGESDRSRFAASKDVSFVKLRPELVLEVRYDQLEGRRFRHTVQFERWRPDREARSCTFGQLETVAAYDLADVLD